MTAIDPQSDAEIRIAGEQLTVKVPLDRQITDGWVRRYQLLARATNTSAYPHADADRSWIVVRLPASSNEVQVRAVMDAARALISQTDLAAPRMSTTTPAEKNIRE